MPSSQRHGSSSIRRCNVIARHVERPYGQSLVEVVVAMLVLVPLSAGVMLLGQYIHLQQTTQLAAREAAWAATVDPALLSQSLPDAGNMQARLRADQFAAANQAIRSNVAVPSQYADPMLTTFAGKTLLQTADLSLVSYSQTSPPSIIGRAMDSIGVVLDTVGLKNSLPPNKQGLVTAQVTATSQQVLSGAGHPVAFLGATATERFAFSATTVLLADSWDSAGSGETRDGDAVSGASANRTVRATISPMVPSTWLGKFTGVVNGAVKVLEDVPFLSQMVGLTSQFELGRTAPDVVPTDKLVPYKNVR
jgi:hypothetical protein